LASTSPFSSGERNAIGRRVTKQVRRGPCRASASTPGAHRHPPILAAPTP
jgi:hypothetical protein